MKTFNSSLLVVSLLITGCNETKQVSETVTPAPVPAVDRVTQTQEVKKPVPVASQPYTPAPPKTSTASSKPVFPPEPFMDAALNGQLAQVQSALDAGQNPNFTDQDGRTALMLAGFNGHTAIVNVLIGHGAIVTIKDKTNRTALMYSCTADNPKAVKLLLQHGAQVNAIDNHEHWTPLMFAAAEGLTDVVKILLDHQADVNLKDTDGDTAGNFAQQRNQKELAKMLHDLETPAPVVVQ